MTEFLLIVGAAVLALGVLSEALGWTARWAERNRQTSRAARLLTRAFRTGMYAVAAVVWAALLFGAHASCTSSRTADPHDPAYGVPSGR